MPKYLAEASFTDQGLQGTLKDGGTARRQALEEAVASVGGRLESFYYCFGEKDSVVIVDLPNNATAAALALTLGVSGAVRLKTTVLLTPEEIDEAVRVKGEYRAPGK